MRQVFLDTETTGLSVEGGDRLVEIGCLEMVNRQLTGRRLHHYVNPGRPNHPDAFRVHGLSDEFLATQPPFESIAEELCHFLQGAEVIIHNASFDIGFLNVALQQSGCGQVSALAARITDSLALAREIYPGKAASLDALCKRLEVDSSRRTFHGALLDAELLAEVYLRMTRGQESLVIDAGDDDGAQGEAHAIDLSLYRLRVVVATAEERARHATLLTDLDKASKGRTLWRPLLAALEGPAESEQAPAAVA